MYNLQFVSYTLIHLTASKKMPKQYLISQTLFAGLLLMLALATFSDIKERKIPNALVMFGLLFSLIFQCILSGMAGGLDWILGIGVGFLCFIPLYVLRGMAAGDVKLMMAVGGFLGYPLIIKAVICVFLSGGVIAIVFVIIKGRFKRLFTNMRVMFTDLYIKSTSGVNMADDYVMKNSAGRMPYALAIAVGTLIALYLNSAGSV